MLVKIYSCNVQKCRDSLVVNKYQVYTEHPEEQFK